MLIFFTACLFSVSARAADPEPYLLHLPGIGGHMRIDDVAAQSSWRRWRQVWNSTTRPAKIPACWH